MYISIEDSEKSLEGQGSELFSGTLYDFLNTTSCPVVLITLIVASPFEYTSGVIPHTLPQCLRLTLAPYDFSRGTMVIAREVVEFWGVIIFLTLVYIISMYTCTWQYDHIHNVYMYFVVYIPCPENCFKLPYFSSIVGMWCNASEINVFESIILCVRTINVMS